MELADLHGVGLGLDGSSSGKHTDVAGLADVAYDLSRRAYHSQHSAVGRILRQILLLNGAQGLCRGGVATQNDERATEFEEFLHRLKREFIDDVKRANAIRGTRIIAQIDIVVLGHTLAYAVKDGQSAISGIENSYWSFHLRVKLYRKLLNAQNKQHGISSVFALFRVDKRA